jgi:23S rRNA A1618 N6-methylase RlmF
MFDSIDGKKISFLKDIDTSISDKTFIQQIVNERVNKQDEMLWNTLLGTNPDTIATGTTCTPNSIFGMKNLKEALDAVLKYQVRFKRMPYVERHQVVIMDYEKIREEMPFKVLLDDYKHRGKVVFFNPEDEAFLRSNFGSQYFD